MRIELTQESLYAPQTYASTSSAIRASVIILSKKQNYINKFLDLMFMPFL